MRINTNPERRVKRFATVDQAVEGGNEVEQEYSGALLVQRFGAPLMEKIIEVI
jgi:hypothetical protein